ncbi:MAG: XRE family transcriptional regulator [Gammaproteobacteria bacterium]|nr:XRE family transcriptional regulator [Gammaproteobacteria bacterium]
MLIPLVKCNSLLAELPLAELRRALHLSQEQLAAELDVRQPAIAKMEKRADMYISTLRRFIEAMGGQLEIRAYFPDGDVKINQFEDLDKKARTY